MKKIGLLQINGMPTLRKDHESFTGSVPFHTPMIISGVISLQVPPSYPIKPRTGIFLFTPLENPAVYPVG